MMGTSLRRLWLYYSNNFSTTHMMAILALVAFVWWMFSPPLSQRDPVVKSRYGAVHYKKVVEPERMNAEDIQQTLDSLIDTRPVRCRDNKYDFARLEPPQVVSIITEFHDSTFYNLKLTLSSIIEYTPYDLYTEIVVLDDGTTNEIVRQHVTTFLRDSKFNKVKLYRSESYGGQASSWFKSSMAAVGNILVFVDSSVVVNNGWLQPLLSELLQDENQIVVPHADNLLDDNRFFRTDDSKLNLATWSLSTVYYEAPASTSLTSDTIDTPVARGDVIAVRRSFLESIGGIDGGLQADPGAGQHVELSLRTWLCGGTIRVVSCSHVAVRNSLRQRHVSNPWNFRRITELWLDDFGKIAYRQGGLTERLNSKVVLSDEENQSLDARRTAIRKSKLGAECHPFSWYLAHVATTIVAPSDIMSQFGKLRAKTNYCLRTTSVSGVIEMDLCREYMFESEALFEMNEEGAIFRGDLCLAVDEKGGRVVMAACDDEDSAQKWKWTSDSRLTVESKQGHCLVQVSDRNHDTMDLYHFAEMQKCSSKDSDLRKEQWKFIKY